MSVRLAGRELPILRDSDAVVVGGSFAGLSVALTLARAGRKVTLLEPRTYLGRDMTATLRPWIHLAAGADHNGLPEPLTACIAASQTTAVNGELPLSLEQTKRCLEDLLLKAGVSLIYATLPVGVCTVGGGLLGLVVGNKSGRQVVTCRLAVDASSSALVAKLAGTTFEASEPEVQLSYTIECDGVGTVGDNFISVPERLGVIDNRVAIHRGSYGHGHIMVELAVSVPGAVSALDVTSRDLTVRKQVVRVAGYLFSQVSAFQSAHLAGLSYEPHGVQVGPMAGAEPAWAVPLASQLVQAHAGPTVPLCRFATPVVGLWCIEATRSGETIRAQLVNPVVASALGMSLGQALNATWQSAAAPTWAMPDAGPGAAACEGLQIRELLGRQRGGVFESIPVPPIELPVCCDVDVLVVGGGSSGAVAAVESAREGMHTCLVDMNPGLGGTGTYGGVDSYWIGHRGGFVARVAERLNHTHERLGQPRPDDLPWPVWNIEAKNQTWIELAQEQNVELLLNAYAIGTVVQGNTVRGVAVATRAGPIALLGRVIVDATGDGDVAVFAGARYTYGGELDRATMWYSLAQFRAPGRTQNNFSSMVDISNIEDYTRAILTSRRLCWQGSDCYDHGIYIAPRESRHVHGDVTLTLTDHLLRRSWPDTIYIAFSNTDVKGQVSSDWMRVGLIPPQLEIEVPYRTLLPEGLENILVVGKAISATRDSAAAIRMQPDMENLGGVAAMAAAMAVREGRTPRTIDVRVLQGRLVRLGVLHESILERELVIWHPDDAELAESVASIQAPLRAYSDMELHDVYLDRIPLVDVCCAGPRALPILERALERAKDNRRIVLAQALALMGSSAGVPSLVAAIEQQLAGERVPELSGSVRHFANYVPDQAAMPDVAYLLYGLGMARDRRALPVWQHVVDLLEGTDEEDFCSPTRGRFHYVDAICCGAEQLGDPAAIPLLQQLHSYSSLRGKQCHSAFRYGLLHERVAFLEVVVGRALARCGSPEGLSILISYLNDTCVALAEQAHDHLVAVTGEDYGRNVEEWSQWLRKADGALQPVPWSRPTELRRVWWKTILVPRDQVREPRVQIHTYEPGR